ncbi:MAG TPA: hypothetical protein VGK97_11665 [Spongiibacteraceae bacterium]|jgi:caa(3)-type oxidase subunit IV
MATANDQKKTTALFAAIKKPLLTWIALLLLLLLSALSNYWHLSFGNGLINYTVAITKTLLVAAIFMQVWRGPRVLRLVIGVGLYTLILLLTLSLSDYFVRHTTHAPWRAPALVAPLLMNEAANAQNVAERAFDAMMQMKKIDIAAIEAACRG